MYIGVRFPFQQTSQGGMFSTTKTDADAIRTNLISLLTTKRGQRVMNNRLYSPLYDYIFEPWDSRAQSELNKELTDKIIEFIPNISISTINYSFNEESYTLTVDVIYKIPELGGLKDDVSITVNFDDGQ